MPLPSLDACLLAPKRSKAAVFAAESLSGAGGLVLVSCGPPAKRGMALLDETGKVKWQKQTPVQRAVLAPDASLLVVGHQRDLTLLSPAGKSLRTISRKSTHEVRSLAISVDGWLAVGTDDGVELYPLSAPSAASANKASPKGEKEPKKASPKGARDAKKTATASGKASGKTGKGVGAAWSRIEAWLGTNAPSALKSLARGASEKNIAAAEKKLGRSFPSELKESLALHDGDDSSGSIGNWDLLGVSELLAEATLMNKLLAQGTFGDAQGDAHPRIKRTWWNAAWIPIVSSGSGHLFCVDLDPAPQGKVGGKQQVGALVVARSRREEGGSLGERKAREGLLTGDREACSKLRCEDRPQAHEAKGRLCSASPELCRLGAEAGSATSITELPSPQATLASGPRAPAYGGTEPTALEEAARISGEAHHLSPRALVGDAEDVRANPGPTGGPES